MALDWFKLHHSLLNDLKVQRLSPAVFKHWINLLCVVSANEPRGVVPPVADLAFALRASETEVSELLETLKNCELLDTLEDGVLVPHGWEKRQYDKPSDRPEAVKKRVQKHRGKKQQNEGNAGVTPSETPDVSPVKRECNDPEENRGEENRKEQSTATRAPEPNFDDEIPNRPSIESPLAWAVRNVCKKKLQLSARDKEKLEHVLCGLIRANVTVAQVEEFGRKVSGYWIAYDTRTKQARAPDIMQVLEHWQAVLELPEPGEAKTSTVPTAAERRAITEKYKNQSRGSNRE